MKRSSSPTRPSRKKAVVVREFGPFEGVKRIHGVAHDGEKVWFATDQGLHTLDPESGETALPLRVPSSAGTTFDGKHLFQLANDLIQKIDPKTGTILATFPAPGSKGNNSGLAWAEGSLWVGEYDEGRIHQVDCETGRVLRTLKTARFVTGVTFSEGELWHGTFKDDVSEIHHVDRETGELLECVEMPAGQGVSGMEADGRGLFFCGATDSGRVRAVRRP